VLPGGVLSKGCLAGACCGDLLLQSHEGVQWSVQLSTEMALELAQDMLERICENKQQEASDFETLSPSMRRTGCWLDSPWQAVSCVVQRQTGMPTTWLELIRWTPD
jgi:hypothetical protein